MQPDLLNQSLLGSSHIQADSHLVTEEHLGEGEELLHDYGDLDSQIDL